MTNILIHNTHREIDQTSLIRHITPLFEQNKETSFHFYRETTIQNCKLSRPSSIQF